MTQSLKKQIECNKTKAAALLLKANKLAQRQKERERRAEDHFKYTLGGAVLKLMRQDKIWAGVIMDNLGRVVENQKHRQVLGLSSITDILI